MTNQELVIIAAVSRNNVIGNNGEIPWYFPEDLKRFRQLTINHPVVMGRKTYESILKRNKNPLDKRLNIVLSRQKHYEAKNVVTCDSIDSVLSILREQQSPIQDIDFDSAYIIGGQTVYGQTISLVDRLEITRIHSYYDGDSVFPPIEYDKWKKVFGLNRGFYEFITYEKKR